MASEGEVIGRVELSTFMPVRGMFHCLDGTGDFVRTSDYKALQSQLTALRAERDARKVDAERWRAVREVAFIVNDEDGGTSLIASLADSTDAIVCLTEQERLCLNEGYRVNDDGVNPGLITDETRIDAVVDEMLPLLNPEPTR